MSDGELSKGQVVALLKDIADMATRSAAACERKNVREFLMAITQLESAMSVLSDITEFPADAPGGA